MVRIRRSHRRGPGSIPGVGMHSDEVTFDFIYRNVPDLLAQNVVFPRTQNCKQFIRRYLLRGGEEDITETRSRVINSAETKH